MEDPIHGFDMVALLSDLPEHNLTTGQTGAVVLVHGAGEAFEVEFPISIEQSVVATVERRLLLKLKGSPQTRVTCP
jgi:hypothetical protein